MASEGQAWLYYLLDESGRSYYLDNGIVSLSSQPRPLRLSPDGWQQISIGFERNIERLGSVRNFTLPLGYVIEAATIIRTLFYTKNFEEKVYILIQKQALAIDLTTYHFWYKYFYKGEIDLSTFNGEENKVTVNVMEGGLSKLIKANEATTYEIPCDEIFVRMDGVELFKKGNFSVLPELEINNALYGTNFIIPITHLQDDGLSTGLAFLNEDLQDVSGETFADKIILENGIVKAEINNTAPITVTISGNVIFKNTVHALGTWGFRARFLKNDLTVPTQNDYEIFSQTPIVLNQTYTFPVSISIDLNPGETLKLEGIYFGGSAAVAIEFQDGSDLAVNFSNRFAATNILAVKPYTLYNRLIERITGDAANAVSTLLGEYEHLLVTSGDAIRGINGAVIKTSLNDVYTSYGAILCAGMGQINNKQYFERREYFLNSADPISLNKCKDIKERLATEFLYNTLKIGYPDQEYKDVNGKQEYNTTHQYSSPVTRVVKSLELVSKYRADCFGIEYVRINLEGKTTTDDRSDNDVFILNVNLQDENIEDGSYNLRRETYDVITGVLSPTTVFNIEDLTPARMMKKWQGWLNSIFYGFPSQLLKFETTDKNGLLYTEKDGVIYDEDADFVIENTPRTFKPQVFEVTPETPEDIVEQLEENPNRCFQFTHWNGDVYTGFNLKIGIAANTMEEQQFELLSTNENDLTTLAL